MMLTSQLLVKWLVKVSFAFTAHCLSDSVKPDAMFDEDYKNKTPAFQFMEVNLQVGFTPTPLISLFVVSSTDCI